MIIKKKQFLFPSTHFARKKENLTFPPIFFPPPSLLSNTIAEYLHLWWETIDRKVSCMRPCLHRVLHTRWIEEGAADHVPLSPRRGSVTIREFAMRRRRCTPSFLHRCICYWICLKLFEFDQRMCLKSCTIFERRWREEERGWRGVFSSIF